MDNMVSVIIPTYKRRFKTIERAINSVLKQTYKNIELLIVDDNPEEFPYRLEVKKEIEEIDDYRIVYIKHSENMGACVARNTGIKHAKGNYVAFLDDDDEWMENKIEIQMQKMKDPSVGLVYCASNTVYLDEIGNSKRTVSRIYRKSGYLFEELIKENFVGSTSFVLLRKEVFEKCGGFNEEMLSAQDAELWLRVSKLYKIDYVDIPLVNYYIHSGERISTNITKKIQGLEKINELYKEYFLKNPKVYSVKLQKLTPFYVKNKQYKKAISNYCKAFKLNPFGLSQHLSFLLKMIKNL